MDILCSIIIIFDIILNAIVLINAMKDKNEDDSKMIPFLLLISHIFVLFCILKPGIL